MKKITLKSVEGIELLNRDELKTILGGSGGSGTGSNICCICNTGNRIVVSQIEACVICNTFGGLFTTIPC